MRHSKFSDKAEGLGNLNVQAGSPCKGPPPIFWAWAASPHGRLPGTTR